MPGRKPEEERLKVDGEPVKYNKAMRDNALTAYLVSVLEASDLQPARWRDADVVEAYAVEQGRLWEALRLWTARVAICKRRRDRSLGKRLAFNYGGILWDFEQHAWRRARERERVRLEAEGKKQVRTSHVAVKPLGNPRLVEVATFPPEWLQAAYDLDVDPWLAATLVRAERVAVDAANAALEGWAMKRSTLLAQACWRETRVLTDATAERARALAS